jgi:hypothetical protein
LIRDPLAYVEDVSFSANPQNAQPTTPLTPSSTNPMTPTPYTESDSYLSEILLAILKTDAWTHLEGVPGNPLAQIFLQKSQFVRQ